MKLRKLVQASLVLAATTTAMGQSAPLENVEIEAIEPFGTACPAGSTTVDISSDKKAFTVLFDNYIVQAGSGIPITESRKYCQMKLRLKVPQGWQYSIVSAQFSGFASIPAGGKGEHHSKFYFLGNASKSTDFSTTYTGRFDSDYMTAGEFVNESVVWSACGDNRILHLKTSINLSSPSGASAIMTMDSADGESVHKYGIQWKRCNRP